MATKHRFTIGIRENGVDDTNEAIMFLVQAEFIRAWIRGQTLSGEDVLERVEYPTQVSSCIASLLKAGVIVRGEAPSGKSEHKYYRPAKGARFYGSIE